MKLYYLVNNFCKKKSTIETKNYQWVMIVYTSNLVKLLDWEKELDSNRGFWV